MTITSTAVTVVDSIATLRTLSTGALLVYAQGYSSFGDGGEGLFALGATGTDNAGTIIKSANGTYYRETDGAAFNVKWFGAKGNGSTDDTSAIQACLTAASMAVSGAGAVFVPRGIFVLSRQLTYAFAIGGATGLTFYGAGPDVSTLSWASGQGMLVTYHDLSNSVTVRGLSLVTGTRGGANIGLQLTFSGSSPDAGNSAMNLIENCTFRGSDGYAQANAWGTSVAVNAVPNINFVSCNIVAPNGLGNYGVYLVGTAGTLTVIYNFTNCYFQGGNYAIGYGTRVQGVSIEACNFVGCNYAVFSQGSETDLVQLTITSSQIAPQVATIGLGTFIGDVFLTGNLIYGVKSQPAVNFPSVNVITIVGNQFVGVGSGDSGVAITATQGPVGGTITSNVFYNCGGQGIFLGSGTRNINVQSNNYANTPVPVTNQAGANNTIGGGSA